MLICDIKIKIYFEIKIIKSNYYILKTHFIIIVCRSVRFLNICYGKSTMALSNLASYIDGIQFPVAVHQNIIVFNRSLKHGSASKRLTTDWLTCLNQPVLYISVIEKCFATKLQSFQTKIGISELINVLLSTIN